MMGRNSLRREEDSERRPPREKWKKLFIVIAAVLLLPSMFEGIILWGEYSIWYRFSFFEFLLSFWIFRVFVVIPILYVIWSSIRKDDRSAEIRKKVVEKEFGDTG